MDITVGPSHHDPHSHLHPMGDLPSEPSSPDSNFDESDLFNASITDEVTAQLIAAGVVKLTVGTLCDISRMYSFSRQRHFKSLFLMKTLFAVLS